MWTCPNCRERIEDQFDTCWKCATKKDGTPPANPPPAPFEPSTPAPPPAALSPACGSAFLKGGCGCLALFALVAFVAVALGGHAHADLGGLIILFLIGGVIGLIVFSIYNRGRKDAFADKPPDKPTDNIG